MKSRKYICWGALGHAKVIRECLDSQGRELAALFDNNPDRNSPFDSIPLHIGKQGFATWRKANPGEFGCVVAIGGNRGVDRLELLDFLVNAGLEALVVIHSRAFVATDAEIGHGTHVLALAAVCADARLGRGCIVNTSASVDHECVLEPGVHVGPGAHLAGCVQVGRHAMIGAGAVVLPNIHVGAGAVIGAGAVVTKNVADDTVVVGNPARVLKMRSE